jgi:hypothetical protein
MSQGVFGNFPEFFEIFWAFFALCKHIIDFLGFVFALKMISEKKENLFFYFGPSPRARPIRPKPRPPPHPIKGRSPRRAPPAPSAGTGVSPPCAVPPWSQVPPPPLTAVGRQRTPPRTSPRASGHLREQHDVEPHPLRHFPSLEKRRNAASHEELESTVAELRRLPESGCLRPTPPMVSTSPRPSRAPLPIPPLTRVCRSPERWWFSRPDPRPELEEAPYLFSTHPVRNHVIYRMSYVFCIFFK